MSYDRRKTAADLTYPTVHLNGTGKQGLLDQQLDMMRTIRKALDSLRQNFPHGRDYYTQDAGAVQGPSYQKARREQESRIERLQAVYDEIESIAEHIADLPGR
jgi:hypothetical protein